MEMDKGVLATDHTLNVRYRDAVFEEGSAMSPCAEIVFSVDASPDAFREFLVRRAPARFPLGCKLRVSAFLLSLGMGPREQIAALRYRSVVETVLRGGVPFLRAANDAGWDGDRFLSDPVFPSVRHGVVLSCIARRVIRPELSEADAVFVRTWLWPHVIIIQDGVFAALECPLRTDLLRAVPLRYMADCALVENVRAILDEGTFDPAELHRWGKLSRAWQMLIECSVEPFTKDNLDVFARSLRYLNTHQASRVLRSCLCADRPELIRIMAETSSVDMDCSELRTVMDFVRRTVQLEELLADAVQPNILGPG